MRGLTNSELFDDYAREASVASLRTALDLAPKPVEHNPLLISPLTIGIEIEENWRQALPELAEKWIGKKPLSLRYLLHRPSFAREYRDAETYALHMTVAGFTRPYDAYTFLTAQELSGATTPQRILGAISTRQGSWSQKGQGGIKPRTPDELSGEDTIGHEFRSFCVTSRDQLVHTLGNAVQFAALYSHSPDEWRALRSQTMARLADADLPLSPWNNPKQSPELWERYAGVLREGAVFYS